MYKGRGRGEGRNRIGKNQSMSGRNGARWKFFSGWANFVQFEIEFEDLQNQIVVVFNWLETDLHDSLPKSTFFS